MLLEPGPFSPRGSPRNLVASPDSERRYVIGFMILLIKLLCVFSRIEAFYCVPEIYVYIGTLYK